MSRPTPRRSALSGSPIAPPATSTESTTTEAVEPAAVREAPASTSTPPTVAEEKRPAPSKTAFYQDRSAAARMRATYLHTLALEDYNSLSAFIAQAVEEKVQRLEEKHNDGRSWPAVAAGGVPTGRPPRTA